MHEYLAQQLFAANHRQLRQQANHDHLIRVALRARRANRRSAREKRALRLAVESLATGAGSIEPRPSVPSPR